MASAVCDAGPLIHLAEINRVDLLNQFAPLWIPTRVAEEAGGVATKVPGGILVEVPVIEHDRLPARMRARLHRGELDALAVCRQKRAALFLTDDLDAREAAQRLGIQPHGTVGIVVRGFRAGRLRKSEAVTALRDLQQISSLFVTSEIIEIAIEQLNG